MFQGVGVVKIVLVRLEASRLILGPLQEVLGEAMAGHHLNLLRCLLLVLYVSIGPFNGFL